MLPKLIEHRFMNRIFYALNRNPNPVSTFVVVHVAHFFKACPTRVLIIAREYARRCNACDNGFLYREGRVTSQFGK